MACPIAIQRANQNQKSINVQRDDTALLENDKSYEPLVSNCLKKFLNVILKCCYEDVLFC